MPSSTVVLSGSSTAFAVGGSWATQRTVVGFSAMRLGKQNVFRDTVAVKRFGAAAVHLLAGRIRLVLPGISPSDRRETSAMRAQALVSGERKMQKIWRSAGNDHGGGFVR